MSYKAAAYHGPIRSPEIESMVIQELHARRTAYALVYRLIRETGIDFTHLTHLKVSDLIEKEEITFTTHSGKPRTMPLSKSLQKALNEYFLTHNPESLAFTGKSTSTPLKASTFTTALRSVSRSIGIDPAITVTTIRLTFVYHLVLKDGNCVNARNFVTASSAGDVYRRLGIDPKDVKGEYLEGRDPKEKLFKYDLMGTLEPRLHRAIMCILSKTDNLENSTNAYARKALALVERIDSALTIFETTTQTQEKQEQ